MPKLFKLLIILLIPVNIYSQDIIFFKNVAFCKPFISDIRTPLTKLEIGYLNKISPYYYNENVNSRPFIESHLGYDLNIFSISKGKSKFALSFPGGASTLTDMFEKNTAPVINTDYWFGSQIKYIVYPFNNTNLQIKNISLKLQPVFHESTHLGDEFVIHGYYNIPEFKRINISYEAWSLSFTLNDPDTIKGNLLSFNAGIQNLWTIKDGFYFADSLEVKGENIIKSQKTFEYHFLINYKRTQGFLCSENRNNIISLQVQNRIRFNYENPAQEKRVWSINAYFGWIFKISDLPFNNIGFFIRYYYGLNPHGQFRNSNNFSFSGIGIALM